MKNLIEKKQKLKCFHIIRKKGKREEIIDSTDKPFDWFPELRTMFHRFNVKEMRFDLDTKKEFSENFKKHCRGVTKVSYLIKEG